MALDPHILIGFYSELEKIAYKVDEKATNERLRVGSGPLWAAGGALAGMAASRKLLQTHGPKAFWPIAIMSALPAALAAKFLHRAATGEGSVEQEIAARALGGARGRPAA
jgi:hypothetical protein